MKNYRNVNIEKRAIVNTLNDIMFKGINGMTPEQYESHKDHPIYSTFTNHFAEHLQNYSYPVISPLKYTKQFLELMENLLQKTGKHELHPGRLQKIHNYFDVLVETVASRAIKKKRKSKKFAYLAKKRFNEMPNFVELHDHSKRTKTA
jgi:hypothetical protein